MKIRTTTLVTVMALSLIQGCSSVIPIKAQTSKTKEVAECIADANSHGQCSQNKAFLGAHIPGSDASYFNALGVMELPETIDENKLSRFSGGSTSLSNTFNSYTEKYNRLNCVSSYNKEAARIAKDALASDTNKNIHELFKKQLSGGSASTTNIPTIEFKTKDYTAFMENMTEADSYGGVNSLQCAALQNMSFAKNSVEIDELGALVEELSYTKAYFDAYFRQGRFIRGEIKVSELYNKLKVRLKNEAPFLSDDQRTDLINGLFKRLTGKEYAKACPSGSDCTITYAGKLEATQFVTRTGVEYGFPHITVSVDPLAERKISVTEIDWNKVGAEVAKVYIEAVGDRLIGLPADPRSTACRINNVLCYSEQNGGISADDFVSVGEHSDKIDTLVSNAVGKVIRGGWWISLNNEAVASIIESAVGTAAKKVAEKVAYCTYSCITANKKSVMPSLVLGEVKVKVTR